jgi:hypothetical protein
MLVSQDHAGVGLHLHVTHRIALDLREVADLALGEGDRIFLLGQAGAPLWAWAKLTLNPIAAAAARVRTKMLRMRLSPEINERGLCALCWEGS